MNRAELSRTIFQLTDHEKENLLLGRNKRKTGEAAADLTERSSISEYVQSQTAVVQGVVEAEQYTADRFMGPLDKLRVNKQERFEPIAPHKHDYIELCYVWSGSCEQEIEGKKITTQQGDVCIFDTQAVHSIAACGEQDIIVNIMMKKNFFDAASRSSSRCAATTI